ncbi:phage major tail tube protein [Dyella sp. Tek66A03]|uniref:phage major tail tube protein n=1 Tax=Dyella sp. Tek66A03 TaxID=3458298 RepID=UPI00403E48E5
MRTYGNAAVNGAMFRFAGAYQAEGTGSYDAVEGVVRGRYTELDFGDSKTGADTRHKYNFRATYCKLSVNGSVEIEIDILNGVFTVSGVDRLAAERRDGPLVAPIPATLPRSAGAIASSFPLGTRHDRTHDRNRRSRRFDQALRKPRHFC